MTHTDPAAAGTQTSPCTVVVRGTSTLSVTPDAARLLVSLTSREPSRAAATSELKGAQGRLNAVLSSFDRSVAGVQVSGSRVVASAADTGQLAGVQPAWDGSADLSVDVDAHVVPAVLAELRKVTGVRIAGAAVYRIKDARAALAEARTQATQDAYRAARSYAAVLSGGGATIALVAVTELDVDVHPAAGGRGCDERLLTGDIPAMTVRALVEAEFLVQPTHPHW